MKDKSASALRKIVSRTWMLILLIIFFLLVIKPVSITLHDIGYTIMENRAETSTEISISRESPLFFVIEKKEFIEGISFYTFGGYLFLVPAAILLVLYNETRHIWNLLGLHFSLWLINTLFLFAGISGWGFMLYIGDYISRYMIGISLIYLVYIMAKKELQVYSDTNDSVVEVED